MIRPGVCRVGLAAIALLALCGSSGAQSLEDERGPVPTLEITPGGVDAFRAAVLRFRAADDEVGANDVEALRSEIEAGLEYSNLVLPLAHDAYLGPEESSPLDLTLGFDCEPWRQGGADALLQGEVKGSGSQLQVEMRIWDIARCRELRTGQVRGGRGDLAEIGRRIADETVEALTGERGVAATEIAFISDREGSREVFVMSADGRDQRPATHSKRIKMFPEWMPDGRALLYVSYDGLQPGLFLTSRSEAIRPGPILRQLMPGAPKYRGRFDPSGDELAVVTSVDGAAEIYRVKRRGSQATRLTNQPAIDISPSWSPDGTQIVFCSDRSGSPQLYIMDRDGENLRRLTYTGAYNTSPAWSPDGRWIAYETRVRGQFDIWLTDPSGTINFPIAQHRLSDEGPTWSPDSRKIAFSSARRGRYDIYVMDWNGDHVRRLTEHSGQNLQPDWGPPRP